MVSKVFKLEYPFFTTIAAIFSMENSVASSYKAGLFRMIGTLVGAFVGVIFIYIQPGNALLMGIGTLVLIFICNTFKWDRAVPIAGVMFAAIMLSLNNKNPLQYSLSRILDTFIGIVIAVSVNYLIFPPNNMAQIRKNLDGISEKISVAVVQFVCSGIHADLSELRREIIDSVKFLESYKIEFNPKPGRSDELSIISSKLELLRNIVAHLETVDALGPRCCLSSGNLEMLWQLELCRIEAKEYSDTPLNTIYNYHVGKILESLPKLTSKQVEH